jgi:hypothetical protein
LGIAYQKQRQTANNEISTGLSTEVKLPKKWLQQLQEAIYSADFLVMEKLVAEIDTQYPETATTCKNLVNDFKYDELTEWIKEMKKGF